MNRTRLLLTIGLAGCLVWLALSFFRQPVPEAGSAVLVTSAKQVSGGQENVPPKLEGEQAREYLEQTSDGQSLMQAVTAARFGLKWQEHAPGARTSLSALSAQRESGGYLGMSHDQNLNAWFDEAGVTVRPTVPEKERAHAWQLGFSLKSYGYGERLVAAPPIVAHKVKENRIEYERAADFRFPILDFGLQTDSKFQQSGSDFQLSDVGFKDTASLFNPKSKIQNPKLIEWYENRAEGIEQGFTVNSRPARTSDVAANEPLRLVVSLSGDLRARAVDEGQKIELLDAQGKGALSYNKLATAKPKLASTCTPSPVRRGPAFNGGLVSSVATIGSITIG